MRQITLLNRPYQIHPRLDEFNINIGTGTSIAFFGSNPNSSEMFFQFINGSTYIYKGITPEVRAGLWKATSLGSYYATAIKGKFIHEKVEGAGVLPSLLGVVAI